MERPIKLSVFPTINKDGFAVGVRSLSQSVWAYYVERKLLIVPDECKGDVRLRVRAERLKFYKTEKEANLFRDAFYGLPLAQQMAYVNKVMKHDPRVDQVAVTVQYYAVFQGARKVCSTCDLKQLNIYKQYPNRYRIEPTIKVDKLMPKSEYEYSRHRVDEVVRVSKDLVGMCCNVEDIQRHKVKGSDRHQGYRTTTSPNFHKCK